MLFFKYIRRGVLIFVALLFFLFVPRVSLARGEKDVDSGLRGSREVLQQSREDKSKMREELKSKLQDRREELKKMAQGKREEAKKRIEEKQQEKIKQAYLKLTEKVNKIVSRFEELIVKIEARLDKLSETQDVSSIQAEVERAKDKIAQVKADLASLEGLGSDVASSSDPKSSYATSRQMFQEVKKELDEVHKILVGVIGEIKGLRVGEDRE